MKSQEPLKTHSKYEEDIDSWKKEEPWLPTYSLYTCMDYSETQCGVFGNEEPAEFRNSPIKQISAGKSVVNTVAVYRGKHTLMDVRDVNLIKVSFPICLINTGMYGML